MFVSNTFLAAWTPRTQSLLRIVAGFLFLQHATAKLFGVPHNPFFDHLQLFSLVGFAGVLELIGSPLLILGLFTRPVAFILSGEMAVAYFLEHAPHGLSPLVNHGEAAVLYCFIYLFFATAGAGAWSIDAVRGKT
jgi:putative oxidoreductase